MSIRGQGLDISLYFKALPLYARNLGVAIPPLAAAIIKIGLGYLSGPVTDPLGGAGAGIFGLIAQLVLGFSLGISLIFADDAWRHGRASLSSAWSEGRRKVGTILLATLGFFFLTYVAELIGGLFGSIGSAVLAAIAAFFFIYAFPAAAIGGAYGPDVFSISLRLARSRPLPTAILTIVSLFVYFYVGFILPVILGPYVGGAGYIVLQLLLPALAIGYVALVVAKQYGDFSFGRY